MGREQTMTEGTVTARGEASVPGKPDEGMWTIMVGALDATPDAALGEVGTRSDALGTVLDELGVAPERRSTSGVTVREEFDYVDGKQVHRGFRAQNVITVRLTDAAAAGKLIQASIERAKAEVRGPVWWIAPDNPARVEACKRAAAEAKRKAEAYAEALGLQLGAVAEIRESATGPVPMPRGRAMTLAAAETPIDVDPGELNVDAQVEVSFHLEG
jgi:uncharacterized protein YggE